MAIARKIFKVANPRRGRYRLRAKPNRRRNMTPKQIRHFGTKAQKAGLKRRNRAKRSHHSRSSNPRPKVRVIYRYKENARPRKRRKASHHRRRNPALVVTLGSINPKRRKKVAKAKRVRRRRSSSKSNPRHYRRRAAHHRRRTNRRRVAVMNPRRHYRRRKSHNPSRRRHASYRRNPALFGGRSTKSMLKIGGGVLAGVTLTKMIPRYIPANITGSIGSGSVMAVLISLGSSLLSGYVAKMLDPEFGEGVLWGGIAQTISVALNAFLPSVGGVFSLGDLVSGNFVVPQNPIRAGMMAPAMVAAARMSGMGAAAFPPAFQRAF